MISSSYLNVFNFPCLASKNVYYVYSTYAGIAGDVSQSSSERKRNLMDLRLRRAPYVTCVTENENTNLHGRVKQTEKKKEIFISKRERT